MSYQRPDGKGRHYIWMGADGLHNMHNDGLLADCTFKHGPVGRDNAKAMMLGLADFLESEGVQVKIKRGRLSFTKPTRLQNTKDRSDG